MEYPSTIRNDAITAVGAPSTIGFLVKAIYWLYVLASLHTHDHVNSVIEEEVEEGEDQRNSRADAVMEDAKPSSNEDLFSFGQGPPNDEDPFAEIYSEALENLVSVDRSKAT